MSSDIAKIGGIKCKTHLLTFPSINVLPYELIPHFIRGYFDGDGCI